MIYPTISEYKTAVRNAPKTLKTLKDYEPVLRADGEPWFCSGGLAAVFKLRHRVTGEFLALKCFHKYQVDRAETYALISGCLGEYPSSYLVHYEYKDNEIWVNSASAGNRGYPLLAMAWAEGVTLGEYVQKHCQSNNKAALEKLIEEFDWFAFWLLSQPFAHGDLKPDNIIIRPDGKPILLDYDGMYVPAMKGQDASELGSPVYRHPARTVKDFNKRMDDFSLVILLLELRILAANPQAAGKAGESLYFNPEDIRLSALPGMASYLELDARRHPGSIISGHLLRQLEDMLRQQAAQGSLLLHPTLFQSLKKEPLPQIKPIAPKTGKYLEPDMVLIQGGTFEMGDVEGKGAISEKPVHKVALSDYYLARTAVTFEEYDLYCEAMGVKKPDDRGWGRGKHPVINVSWFDAVRYCNWLSEQTGLRKVYTIEGETVTVDWYADGYRLPTEAEWEFAVRGGNLSEGFQYSGSDNLDEVGWYDNNSGGQTHPVGEKKPNELGLYDMSGNVWEWCWDWYDAYSAVVQRDPKGPDKGDNRVLRGGSWDFSARSCRVSYRNISTPDYRYDFLGFRLAAFPSR